MCWTIIRFVINEDILFFFFVDFTDVLADVVAELLAVFLLADFLAVFFDGIGCLTRF